MNIAFLLLPLVLLLAPACRKKPAYAPPITSSVVEPVPAPEKSEYDEELGAFVVKEDENKFSAAAAAQAHEEDLTSDSSEQAALDQHADSGKYGLKTVYFEYDKYKISELRPDQSPVLAHDLAIVKSLANKGYKISIQGHACDSAGSTEYNMMLSEKRAQAVADYLKAHGVEAELFTYGYGCAHLIVASGTREQQAPNRRVEIYASEAQQS